MNIIMDSWVEHCLKVWDTKSAENVRFKKNLDAKVSRNLKALLEAPSIRLGRSKCTCPICLERK